MVEYLLQKGGNVNAEHDVGRTPLHLASKNGRFEFIEQIEIEWKECWIGLGYEKIVDSLIKHGADVNHENGFGKTALHRATEKGYLKYSTIICK